MPRSSNARPERGWVAFVALFLAVAGARLWLISLYGSPVPKMDQWDAEGAFLFKPWLEGTLRIGDLFQPHNEHRIVLSRLLALGLLWLNGQWDAQLEMAVNALLCGAIAVIAALALVRLPGRSYPNIIVLAVGLWGGLPYGHENTLWGFQSSFYFLFFFSLLAVWGMVLHPIFSFAWWLGIAGALLACLSMTSGFLAVLAVLGVVALRSIKQRAIGRESWALVLICISLATGSYYFGATVPHHEVLKAHSLAAWLNASARCLAWPYSSAPVMALLIYLPTGLLIAQYLGRQHANGPWKRRAEVLIGISLWAILQAAAISYGRGGGDVPLPVSRYMDILAFGALANLVAILFLLNAVPGKLRSASLVFAVCWIAAVAFGALRVTRHELTVRTKRGENLYAMEEAVRAYVLTKDARYLEGDPRPTIPYPDGSRLAALLDDATIRNILPAVVRVPLQIEKAEETGNAFHLDGCPPEALQPSYERPWGSFAAEGATQTGTMKSQYVRPATSYLEFEIAGALRKGLSVGVEGERTGKKVRARSAGEQASSWRNVSVAVPERSVRVFADDSDETGWLAFRLPRELARFSYYAGWLTKEGRAIFLGGVILWICAGLVNLRNWAVRRSA